MARDVVMEGKSSCLRQDPKPGRELQENIIALFHHYLNPTRSYMAEALTRYKSQS